MKLRVVTWNINKARNDRLLWQELATLNADLILLQEVVNIPPFFTDNFQVRSEKAVTKKGSPQKFSTVILAKGKITNRLNLKSEHEWVNMELDYFKGYLLDYEVVFPGLLPFKVVSVHFHTGLSPRFD